MEEPVWNEGDENEMNKRVREVVGMVLLAAGVGGIFVGIHGVSGGEKYGGPAIGAGAAANVLAYRVLRTTTKRTDGTTDGESDSAGPKA